MILGFRVAGVFCGLVGDLDSGQSVGHRQGGVHFDQEPVAVGAEFLDAGADTERVNQLHGLGGDERFPNLADFLAHVLGIERAEHGLDVVVGTGVQNLAVGAGAVPLGSLQVIGQLVDQGLITGKPSVLHVDGFGDGVFRAVDHHLGRGVGQDHSPLDGIAPGDEIVAGLESGGDVIAYLGDGFSLDLRVGMFVGIAEVPFGNPAGDAGVQRLEFAKRLVNGHAFSSHLFTSS